MEEKRDRGWRYWSRRRLVHTGVLGSAGVAATAVLAACSGAQRPPDTSGSAQQTQPRRGGILRRAGGQAGSYDTRGFPFDPHVVAVVGAAGYRLVYQGLLSRNTQTLDVEPDLAQTWEQRSPTEYVFTLYPGIRWQRKAPVNGRELTANDVVFSLNRVRSRDPKFVHSSLLTAVDKIEAVDNRTVRITTKEPDAATLAKLSSDGILVLAPEAVERADKWATAAEVVGTGAFILQSLEERVAAEYVRNPDYWRPGLPYLDAVRTLFFNDEETAFAAFLGGQLDISPVPGPETKKYIAQQGPGYVPGWFPQDFIQSIQPNVTAKPLDDARTWKALKLLTDHEECKRAGAELIYGRGRDGSVFSPSMEAWDLSEAEYGRLLEWRQPKDQAVQEALSLLSAAGYSQANPLRFEIASQSQPSQRIFSELLQAQWRQFSRGAVLAEIKLVDNATSSKIRSDRTFHVYQGGHSGSAPEPDTWFTQLYRSGASRNYAGFSDPRLDAMFDRQRGIFDIAQRKAAVREILSYMIDNAPWSSAANNYQLATTKPNVRGWVPEHNIQGDVYERIWIEA
jgi:peptide/nickel transport system substrate-binding protein